MALGLTLIFSILDIINFAHGEFYMLGGFVTYYAFAVFGVNYFLTLVLAVLVVGGAGGLLAPLFAVSPAMGALPVVKAFIIIIVGGMGSLPGAVLGGLLLGGVEGLGALFMGSAAVNILGFLMVIVVLLVRPRGLVGGA